MTVEQKLKNNNKKHSASC